MEQYRREDPLAPGFLTGFLKGRRGVVWFGRVAGVFFLISALALSIWQAVGLPDQFPPGSQLRLYVAWQSLLGTAPWGVIIILLAEVVDRLNGEDGEEIVDSDRDLVYEQ